MKNAWARITPDDVTQDTDLMVYGVNITQDVLNSAKYWRQGRKDKFGKTIAKMSKLLVAAKASTSPSTNNTGTHTSLKPVKVYEGTPAAQFAAGFFFGIRAGGYKVEELDACLRKETKAVATFSMGISELQEALKEDGDPDRHRWGQQEAVRALREMALFIYEMATQKANRQYVCPQLTEQTENRGT